MINLKLHIGGWYKHQESDFCNYIIWKTNLMFNSTILSSLKNININIKLETLFFQLWMKKVIFQHEQSFNKYYRFSEILL